jgi:hypothetical protein
MTDYTKQAQHLADEYARHFHGPTYSLDDNYVDFNLRDATDLIRQAKIEKQNILQRIAANEELQGVSDQQRENVSLLPDREAERIQAEWREQAEAQARLYSESRKRNSQPRSTQGVDPDIREGVISWIKRQKLRGALGGRKSLDKI